MLRAFIILTLLGTMPALAENGVASWYGPGFNGRRTADGSRFNQNRRTLASRTLPLGAWVRIENLRNHRVSVARVNDRGPYVRHRIADVSRRVAIDLEMKKRGVDRVRITMIGVGE